MNNKLSRMFWVYGLLCLSFVLASCSKEDQEKTIVITPFVAGTDITNSEYAAGLSHLSAQVASELSASTQWQVLESQQLDSLNAERKRDQEVPEPTKPADTVTEATYIRTTDMAAARRGSQAALAATTTEVAHITTTTPAEVIEQTLKQYPSANFILLGQVTHFEMRDARVNRKGAALLSRKARQLNTTVQIRIVDVETRKWLGAQTVYINEKLSNKGSFDQQMNEVIRLMGPKLVAATQLTITKQFQVSAVNADGNETQITLDSGSANGIRQGMRFKAVGVDKTASGSLIEIIESYPESAVAKVISGKPMVGHTVFSKLIEKPRSKQVTNDALRIAMGGFYQYGKQQNELDGGILIRSLEQQLKVDLSQYGGLRIVEDSPAVVEQFVARKILTDVSQGQLPRFPLDKLVGLDYLLFGTIEHATLQHGSTRTEQLFGTSITSNVASKVQYDITVYLIDASNGEYALSSRITFDQELNGDGSELRLVKRSVAQLSQRILANLMLKMRPLSVLAVRGDYIVLNHKKALGLKQGDRYLVTTAGETFVDEFTNTSLGAVGGLPVGEVEIAYFDAQGWAIAKRLNGDVPEIGALLQPLEKKVEPEKTVRKLGW